MATPKIRNYEAIILKHKPAAQWSTQNPLLLSGELGIESDTHRMKIGDGVTRWVSLGYTDGELRDRLNALEELAISQAEMLSALINNHMKGE